MACPVRQELRRLATCPGGGVPTISFAFVRLRSCEWEGRRLTSEEATGWLTVLETQKAAARRARLPRAFRGPG
eukprot:3526461-Lingulodinium_polyedra.AAC.1